MRVGTDLSVIIPVWKRTQHFTRVYESVMATTPNAEVLFVVSAGDVETIAALNDVEFEHLIVDGPGGEWGEWARKINTGIAVTDREYIFTGADDLIFHEDWYEEARALMASNVVGVVGTVDLCNDRTRRGLHSTHFLAARWYCDLGTIDGGVGLFDTGYPHAYVDDEAVQTAMFRGAYAHAFNSVVEHKHMLIDYSLDDDVYRHGRAWDRIGRRRYLQRKRMWGR